MSTPEPPRGPSRPAPGRSGARGPEAAATRGILVGRPFGVPVRVDTSWFLVAALITWSFGATVESAIPGLGGLRYAVSFAFALLLYLSVLLHELSHTVTALRFGLPVREIRLHLLGGVSEIGKPAPTPARELLIAAAGPAVSIGLGVLGVLAALALPGDTVLGLLARALALSNLFVGLFNLLPGLPLDGGRVLSAAVWKVTGGRATGVLAGAYAGRVVAVVALFVPTLVAVAAGRTPDLLDLAFGAFVALFIWVGASSSLQAARLQARVPQVQARGLTRRAIPVRPDVPIAEGLRRAGEAGARAMVVVDGSGRPTALVNEAALSAVPADRRPWVPVGDVARRLEPGHVVTADLAGETLIEAMQDAPATEYLVVEPSGAIYGVLATSDVERVVLGR